MMPSPLSDVHCCVIRPFVRGPWVGPGLGKVHSYWHLGHSRGNFNLKVKLHFDVEQEREWFRRQPYFQWIHGSRTRYLDSNVCGSLHGKYS
jgi:hypothetical protein